MSGAKHSPRECVSFVELLRLRSAEQPGEVPFVFLSEGDAENAQLTYAELDRRARAVGALIQSRCGPGERVLLLYQPGLDFIAAFFGCLYAGAVALTAYPPRFRRNTERLSAVVEDAGPALGLTTETLLRGLEATLGGDPRPWGLRWLTTDGLADGVGADWVEPPPDPEASAFLQYTSGSTSRPKGVLLSHGNLLHNSARISDAFGCRPTGIGITWLPPYHDMGLVGGILQPVYIGGPTILMSPMAFLQRPARWLRAISDFGKGKSPVVSGGPNFAYDLCVSKVTPEQKAALDLSCWDVAYVGAEPVRAATLRRFAEAFAPCGFRPESFYPCYGLAESTLMVTGGEASAPPVFKKFDAAALENDLAVEEPAGGERAKELTGCGRARPEQMLLIVNPDLRVVCAPGVVGEVWVSGPSVAKGYWRQPEETERTFGARLAGTREGPFLRTGDLGFLHGGELFVTGRLKDLIIIDGRNHYPQDIELTAEQSHPAVRPNGCAAFSVDVESQERLVILAEVEHTSDGASADEIVKNIRQGVVENQEVRPFDIRLLRPGQLPKTSSGKIQRFNCRADYLNSLCAPEGVEVLR